MYIQKTGGGDEGDSSNELGERTDCARASERGGTLIKMQGGSNIEKQGRLGYVKCMISATSRRLEVKRTGGTCKSERWEFIMNL